MENWKDFPSRPVIKIPCYQRKGLGFHSWSGNYDPTCHVEWPKKKMENWNFQVDSFSTLEFTIANAPLHSTENPPPSLKCVKKMVSHCFTHCWRNILSLFLHDPLLVHHMRLGGRDPWVGPSRAALRSLGSPCPVCVFLCTALTPFICHLNSHINYLTKIFIEVQYS